MVDYAYVGGRVKQRSYPNVGDGIDYDISYNDLGWAVRRYTHETAAAIADFNYSFDNNGNIISQEFAHRASSPDNIYTYD